MAPLRFLYRHYILALSISAILFWFIHVAEWIAGMDECGLMCPFVFLSSFVFALVAATSGMACESTSHKRLSALALAFVYSFSGMLWYGLYMWSPFWNSTIWYIFAIPFLVWVSFLFTWATRQ